MIYVGNPGFFFTADDVECSYNGKFNILLQSDNVVLHNDTIESLVFVVPYDFKQFFRKLVKKYKRNLNFDKIFQFRSSEEQKTFKEYANTFK
ncbi:hypothetical protein ECANGB1_2358 [Enterospora canceri]|uniref:Uncharacterized protein n=1 Tax=Enterospora canceri TaxID=1081671 RepID=A0A1Y1S8J8_9MICR|nr:hypothetical protein ECANGB1_2358 [Enterospora canceri]